MQQWLTQHTLTERLNRASRWQEHQRLVFEAIHNSDTSLLKSLLRAYRESLQKRSTPLLRWGFANCTCEIYNYNISSEDKYQLKRGDYLEEQEVVKENKQLIREAPTLILGYLGLARAYGLAFIDPDLNQYYKTIKEEWETIKINGKEQKIKKITATNPERTRRYRQLREKVLQMDPENPFVHYWDAEGLIINHAPLEKGLDRFIKAYQLGMDFLCPIPCLANIVWCAWKVGQKLEMERYGKELQRLVALYPKSGYVKWTRTFFSECPVIRNLPR